MLLLFSFTLTILVGCKELALEANTVWESAGSPEDAVLALFDMPQQDNVIAQGTSDQLVYTFWAYAQMDLLVNEYALFLWLSPVDPTESADPEDYIHQCTFSVNGDVVSTFWPVFDPALDGYWINDPFVILNGFNELQVTCNFANAPGDVTVELLPGVYADSWDVQELASGDTVPHDHIVYGFMDVGLGWLGWLYGRPTPPTTTILPYGDIRVNLSPDTEPAGTVAPWDTVNGTWCFQARYEAFLLPSVTFTNTDPTTADHVSISYVDWSGVPQTQTAFFSTASDGRSEAHVGLYNLMFEEELCLTVEVTASRAWLVEDGDVIDITLTEFTSVGYQSSHAETHTTHIPMSIFTIDEP